MKEGIVRDINGGFLGRPADWDAAGRLALSEWAGRLPLLCLGGGAAKSPRLSALCCPVDVWAALVALWVCCFCFCCRPDVMLPDFSQRQQTKPNASPLIRTVSKQCRWRNEAHLHEWYQVRDLITLVSRHG